MMCQILLVCALWLAPAQKESAPLSVPQRLRTADVRVLAAIQEGRRVSPNFTSLVEAAERSHLFVYIARSHTLPSRMEGCLVPGTDRTPYVRILLAMKLRGDRLIMSGSSPARGVRDSVGRSVSTGRMDRASGLTGTDSNLPTNRPRLPDIFNRGREPCGRRSVGLPPWQGQKRDNRRDRAGSLNSEIAKQPDFIGAGGGNRTRTPLRAWDFKSHASASFATPAPVNCNEVRPYHG